MLGRKPSGLGRQVCEPGSQGSGAVRGCRGSRSSQPKAREADRLDQEPAREGWEEGAGQEPNHAASAKPPGTQTSTVHSHVPNTHLWVPCTQWCSRNTHNGALHAVVLTVLPNSASCSPRRSVITGHLHVTTRGICDSHSFIREALCSSGTHLARPSGKFLQTLHASVTVVPTLGSYPTRPKQAQQSVC